jgi:enoyl-CoA hydratase/carnithine racemase
MDWFVENRIFSPGHTDPDHVDMALKCLTLAFWDFSKISIVAVNGLAVGGAANIALANYHDFVLASTEGRFMYPFSKIGLTPELGSSYILPRVAGMANAKKVLMKGDWFSASEAKEMGLVSEVLEPAMLMPRAIQLATDLSKKNQAALRLGKRLINSHLRKEMDGVMDIENKTIDAAVQARFSSSKL